MAQTPTIYRDRLKRWSRCTGWNLACIHVLVAAQTPVHSGSMIYFYKGTLINLAKQKNFMESNVFHCVGRTFLKNIPWAQTIVVAINMLFNQNHPKFLWHRRPRQWIPAVLLRCCGTKRWSFMQCWAMGLLGCWRDGRLTVRKLPSLKTTAHPWKLTIRGRSFPVGRRSAFRGYISFREGSLYYILNLTKKSLTKAD